MPKAPSSTTGTLKIGDQWNAITIIAHSQTHPLKAICELTENAIDAGASHVRILRRRSRGRLYLEVEDDGRGVAPDESGVPDFQRIATHLCDSMKRHLDATHRRGVHGEFGIGLLSFWSLGEELRMISGGDGVPLRELCLARGKRQYAIRPVRGRLATGGTRIVVGPLLDATKSLVTGEKIARYLSAELRDRIRRTGVAIDVADQVARKQVRVTPREFDGERLEIPRRYPTPLGDVSVEIYVRGDDSADAAGISLCKDGTRVLGSITELLPFQHTPWDDRRLAGLVDVEPLSLAPGTRSGIVPDAAFNALVEVAPAIERDILEVLGSREQAEAERASRHLLKQVHKAFASALADLPAEEYLFFDIPKKSDELQPQPGSAGGPLSLRGRDPDDPAPGVEATPPARVVPEPGPLATIRISPRHARREPGRGCRLVAVARDEHGTEVVEGLTWAWRVVAGEATLQADGTSCEIMSQGVGIVAVEAIARQWLIEANDRVDVKFVEQAAGDGDGGRGLPSYRLEAEHGQPWRSRYDPRANEIIINSAHRDFLASRTSAARHRRYIGKLYAKEVVLSNFPHESPAEVMERLIELTLRTEDAL
ncbi:MAG: ATP-binding protein [Planctomycetia bacterium]